MQRTKKFLQLLKIESKYEDEPNSILLMARYLLLMYIPYNILMFIYALIKEFYFYSLVFIIAAAMHCLMFALSYKIRPRIFAFFVCMTTITSACILTYGFGWRCSFQNHIYIIFLFIWYDSMLSNKTKFILSVLITTIMGFLSSFTPFGGTILDPASIEYKLVVCFNILIFSIALSVVAFIYCTQYVDIERNLRIYNRKLKLMSETDTLTKLMNRRFAEHELISYDESNNKKFISIALGDIDFFKNINDTYGHECGDYVLYTLAGKFKNHMKNQGFVCRWGGEEFLFVYEGKNGDDARIELEKLRKQIETFPFEYEGNAFNVHMTFGLEEYSNKIGHVKTIESADKKLYLGKESGRNCVVY